MSEGFSPEHKRMPLSLERVGQNWPDKAKPFVAHFTKADFPKGVKILRVPEGKRVIGGLTMGSVAAYDSEGRMVANWEIPDGNKSEPRRWEVVRDPSGRKIAERIVSGSTVGEFDGVTTTVYVFEYNKEGNRRHCVQYTQHPDGQYELDEGWSEADTVIDGKPAWEVDQYYTTIQESVIGKLFSLLRKRLAQK